MGSASSRTFEAEFESPEIADPTLAICDSHRHVWDFPDRQYPIETLRADLLSGHRTEKVVAVECGSHYRQTGPTEFRPIGETEHIVSSDSGNLISGIVGFVDLQGEHVAAVVEAHIEAAGGRFRGVRQVTSWDPTLNAHARRPNPPGVLSSDTFRMGMRTFQGFDLPFDVCVYYHQLNEVEVLARDFPGVTFVLDHLGGPLASGCYAQRQSEVDEQWITAMRALASCSNVTVKLGGISWTAPRETSAPPGLHHAELSAHIARTWRVKFERCIDIFGVDRCMFESNFPPDRSVCTEVELWNAYKMLTAEASQAERRSLFYRTAVQVYRLS